MYKASSFYFIWPCRGSDDRRHADLLDADDCVFPRKYRIGANI